MLIPQILHTEKSFHNRYADALTERQNGYKNVSGCRFTGDSILNREGFSSPIDLHHFAGLSLDTHGGFGCVDIFTVNANPNRPKADGIAWPKIAGYNDHIIQKGKTPLYKCANATNRSTRDVTTKYGYCIKIWADREPFQGCFLLGAWSRFLVPAAGGD